MEVNVNEKENVPAYVSRQFVVEVVLPEKKLPTFIVREMYPQGMAVVSTLGTYKELCQFFESIKR